MSSIFINKIKSFSQRVNNDLPYQNGFENENVCCYRNSVLQALFSLKPLNDNFNNAIITLETFAGNNPQVANFNVLFAFGKMVGLNHKTKYSSKLTDINKAFRHFSDSLWKFGIFTNNLERSQQQDPHEFLILLLTHFDEATIDFNRVNSPNSTVTINSIKCLFTFELNQITNCPSNHIHSKRQYELGFTINTCDQESKSLKTILHSYLNDNTIKDYFCDICAKKYAICKQRFVIDIAPEVMIIQLRRFRTNGTKNLDEVSIPLIFNLNDTLTYELTAIIFHEGNSIQRKLFFVVYFNINFINKNYIK